jgi:hypothetical protein
MMATQSHDEDKENKSEASSESKGKKPERLPFLLSFTFSLAQLVVILLGLSVAVLSMLSGATLFMAVLRASAAMLSVGVLLYLVNWLISRNSLEIIRQQIISKREKYDVDQGTNTLEKAA